MRIRVKYTIALVFHPIFWVTIQGFYSTNKPRGSKISTTRQHSSPFGSSTSTGFGGNNGSFPGQASPSSGGLGSKSGSSSFGQSKGGFGTNSGTSGFNSVNNNGSSLPSQSMPQPGGQIQRSGMNGSNMNGSNMNGSGQIQRNGMNGSGQMQQSGMNTFPQSVSDANIEEFRTVSCSRCDTLVFYNAF